MGMGVTAYRDVLARRAARRVVVLGMLIRIPLWAANVALTLHVVGHLHRSYAAAGGVVTAITIGLSVGGPLWGRRLDRVGLRAATAPCLLGLTACWAVAPFTGYWPLLGFALAAGLFTVPAFSIVRQALLHAVPESRRRAALSVDSVGVEISFMIGPPLGVLAATTVPTTWAVFGCQFASIVGGIALWLANPPLREPRAPGAAQAPEPDRRGWVSASTVAVLTMTAAAVVVLTGTDVGIVAALRAMHHTPWIGAELAVWGLGSAIGGLVYGALHRAVPVPVLLILLAATTVPVALAPGPVTLAGLLAVTGLFCAPTITATVDVLSRAVPETVRGEALGWHGTALTVGAALGAPLAGVAIDHAGWRGGFVAAGLFGLLVALVGVVKPRAGRPVPDRPLPDRPLPAAAPAPTGAVV